ncbi:hypothetical protein AAFC00_005147 [Neodothiora populina]|uniref:MOZ protein represents a chromatin-associated acetyltransferase n=1 Tax=Neodothiora populina TaxID=2781224 RepID=A0ABR3PJY0_9PEZI
MSAPRLTFLYPFLFAPAVKPATVREASRSARRAFTTTNRKRQPPAVHQRYGTANEPPPHLERGKPEAKSKELVTATTPEADEDTRTAAKSEAALENEQDAAAVAIKAKAGTTAKEKRKQANKIKGTPQETEPPAEQQQQQQEDQRAIEALPPTGKLPPTPVVDGTESAPLAGPSPQPQIHARPLETVLNMAAADSTDSAGSASTYTGPPQPASTEQTQQPNADAQQEQPRLGQRKPPHISTPPYIHHFDTYGLVRRLEEGGWTQAQAITLMKAVRLILSENMDLAHHGLVSKSNVENESYLFSAACSELKTEIQMKRTAEGERSRTDRTQLQHEVEILSQRMTQESATMKDELKGMFDDRKMFVRNDQRDAERKIQELNYRITVSLNSDSRSDVEGVRWIITKRAISALAICVAMILGSIKFASSVAQWEEEEKKQLAAARKQSEGLMSDNMGDNSPKALRGNGSGSSNINSAEKSGTDEIRDILVKQGDNPAFVSLG